MNMNFMHQSIPSGITTVIEPPGHNQQTVAPTSQNPWFKFAPKPQPLLSGNEPAAAAIQAPFRGGNSIPTWGQNSDQFQIQMISEICQQVMKNLMTKPAPMYQNCQWSNVVSLI